MPQKLSRKQQRAAQRRKSTLINISWLVGGVLLVAAIVLLALPKGSSSSTSELSPARIGQKISDLKLQDLNDKTVRLSDYSGQPVLLNAWATWCPPCKAEMPDLQKYYDQHQSVGLVLLAINAGETANQVTQFIQFNGFTFPVLLDPNVQTLNSLGVNSFPTSILIGRDGVVKTIHIGMFTPQALDTEITPFLSE
jgi:peroxiredoxin